MYSLKLYTLNLAKLFQPMKTYLKQFIHNAIIHPLMMFMPVKAAHIIHDKNANWAFSLNRYDEITLEYGYNLSKEVKRKDV